LLQQHQHALKSILLRSSNLFESLGFRYFGPVNGHDVVKLTHLLKDLRNIPGPKLLHVHTVKGKGFAPAEENSTKWHAAPGRFDIKTGELYTELPDKPQPPKYQYVFGKTILELARKNEKIVGITPAMPTGCSLSYMMAEMPDRTFDVGIAEQHAVTFSAGMAANGMIPFCNIYSSFMQRSYDQIIHDVALQKLNVVFCMDRGGLVGADGPTHHGVFDLAFMRSIPNMIVSAPMNETELRNMMYTAQLPDKGPFSIRYPRGNTANVDWECEFKEIPVGKGRVIADGDDAVVLSVGHPGNFVVEACENLRKEGIGVTHCDMRFVKPLDSDIIDDVIARFDTIITVEDGVVDGGFGSAVLEYISEKGSSVRVHRMGVPDKFIEHGTQKELYRECGFDSEGIFNTVINLIKK
jgi:1-deoxy-D-xylulose-5-phosphate synthase